MKKTFSTLAVLTVMTGWMLVRPKKQGDNGIGQVYELQNWLVSGNLMTHQLTRVQKECEPWLRRWFPELANLNDEIK